MFTYNQLLNSGNFPVCNPREARGLQPDESHENFEYFLTQSTPLVRYLFHDVERYCPHGLKVNYRACWDLMDQMAEPFYAQFVDTTDNREFLRIANDFFHAAFWKGHVYIGKSTYAELAESSAIDEQSATLLENLDDGDEHYHLYYDGGVDVHQTDQAPIFTHLETGLIFEIEDWKEKLIKFRWGRSNSSNILGRWFTFAVKVIMQERDFDDLAALCKKRIIHHQSQDKVEDRKSLELEQMLYSPSSLVRLGEGDLVQEKVFLTPIELYDFQRAGFTRRDRWIAELGIVANTNPKMERLTTGENYKDIVSVADRQRATLNNLKYFAMIVKERWGDDLNFALNGLPKRAEMEGDVEEAHMVNQDMTQTNV